MLDKVFNTLSNLETLYQDGDLKTKRRIIGSIFPEKLVFNGNNYRTARVNEAVELIYSVGQGFSENKNGQTEVNFDLSTQVNRIGLAFALLRSSNYSCEVLTQSLYAASRRQAFSFLRF
jgi:site-specific DNA recombinase